MTVTHKGNEPDVLASMQSRITVGLCAPTTTVNSLDTEHRHTESTICPIAALMHHARNHKCPYPGMHAQVSRIHHAYFVRRRPDADGRCQHRSCNQSYAYMCTLHSSLLASLITRMLQMLCPCVPLAGGVTLALLIAQLRAFGGVRPRNMWQSIHDARGI